MKGVGEGLRAQPGEKRVPGGRSLPPEHRAEPSRVAIAKALSVVEPPVDMVVRTRRITARHESKAPGHSEMDERGSVAGAREEVLGAPGEPGDPVPLEPLGELGRNGPAQARLADQDPLHASPHQLRLELAPGRLDLGQLRHARRPVPPSPALSVAGL